MPTLARRTDGSDCSTSGMTTNPPDQRKILEGNLREAFGRVVYSHKTHEKARELESRRVVVVKWINITLTTLTSGTLLSTVITNSRALLYASSGLAAATLAFIIFQLSFDPEKEAESHRKAAKDLWYLRELYVNLLTDIRAGLDVTEATRRRDALTVQLRDLYNQAPNTSSKAYKAAGKALKLNQDMTFGADEIDNFLPSELHAERAS